MDWTPHNGVAITFTDDAEAETSGGSTSSGYTGYVSLPAHTITSVANTLTTGGYNAYIISSAALSGFLASSTSATLSERNQTIALYLPSDTVAAGAPTVTALSGTTASITIATNGSSLFVPTQNVVKRPRFV